jgi:hypothetical protein
VEAIQLLNLAGLIEEFFPGESFDSSAGAARQEQADDQSDHQYGYMR